jgi:multisubunit Na+/H+ antiporter MnhG subunit
MERLLGATLVMLCVLLCNPVISTIIGSVSSLLEINKSFKNFSKSAFSRRKG